MWFCSLLNSGRASRAHNRLRSCLQLEPLEERAVPAAGDLDLGFGVGGKWTVSFNAGDVATAMAVDSQGRIVVAGYTAVAGGNDFAIARLLSNGALDSSFGAGGKSTA